MENKVVTIEDIAKMAGVGKGTVDRVLHNRGRVSEETKKKVLHCIEVLDYHPNKAARMLAKKKIYRVAVVYHNAETEFWNQISEGIAEVEADYRPNGVVIERFILPKIDVERQLSLIREIIEKKYDGLAIVPYDSEKIVEEINKAITLGIRVVTFNNHDARIHCSYVGQNGVQGGRTAGRIMSMIAKNNSKYVIFSAHDSRMTQIDERSEGFQEIIGKYRKDMTLKAVFNFPEEHDIVYNETKKVLTLMEDNVDAIYVTSAVSSTIARAVEAANLKRHIAFIGHDITETTLEYMNRGIIDVSIGQEPQRQGYLAVDKICRNLLADEQIDQDIYTRISVVVAENAMFS